MKILTPVILAVLGFYWLFDHYPPNLLNHESFGLYLHDFHMIIGIVLLAIAGYLFWKQKIKKLK